jgi:type IV secretory pathway VirB10-like protein
MSEAGPREEGGEVAPAPATAAEPMRLRGDAPRVTRLSRKALTGIGLVTFVGIGGALLYALQTHPSGKPAEELYSTDNRATADGLAALPHDYAGVPKLGPPLPGDLGRPILNAENRGQVVSTPNMPAPAPGPSAEEQKRLEELESARTSKLFSGANAPTGAGGNTQPNPPPAQTLANLGLAPAAAATTAQDRQTAFLTADADRKTVSPDRVQAPASANVLQAGAVIPAAMITGIRSDLPGQITAQVTQNVYDSPTGRILLVPQGTRIIGQYDNNVGFGQNRVLLAWNRLIFPNGRSIVLERQPGADSEGYAGLQDGVDHHWGELFKAALLSTILSVGSEAGYSGNESDIARALQQGASNSTSQIGQQIVGRQLTIAPTLTIRPGFPVRVIVTHDLVLEPYGA